MITKVYDHVPYQVVNGVLTGEKRYSLYQASVTAKSGRILILDADGLITAGVSKYTLVPVDPKSLTNLTSNEKREFEKVIKSGKGSLQKCSDPHTVLKESSMKWVSTGRNSSTS